MHTGMADTVSNIEQRKTNIVPIHIEEPRDTESEERESRFALPHDLQRGNETTCTLGITPSVHLSTNDRGQCLSALRFERLGIRPSSGRCEMR